MLRSHVLFDVALRAIHIKCVSKAQAAVNKRIDVAVVGKLIAFVLITKSVMFVLHPKKEKLK